MFRVGVNFTQSHTHYVHVYTVYMHVVSSYHCLNLFKVCPQCKSTTVLLSDSLCGDGANAPH